MDTSPTEPVGCLPEGGGGLNIAEEIFAHADPTGPAVIEGEFVLSFGDLDRASAAVAKRLLKVIRRTPPARIGLRCPDGAAYIVLALGILRAGGCVVPIAPELTLPERDLLTSTIRLDFAVLSKPSQSMPVDFDLVPMAGDFEQPEWLDRLAALEPALIRFSSGTTGQSKGVVLSHQTLRDRVVAANAALKIGRNDRVLWVLPMSHHFAVSILLYLWHGATIVLPESSLADGILESAVRHRATVLYAAPFHYGLLAGTCGAVKWSSLRMAVSTTASLSQESAEAFFTAFGVFPAQALGLIEVGLPCVNVPDAQEHPGSVGRVQPAFDFELRDPEGRPVPPSEQGELFLKGPGMFDAYVDPWRERAVVAPEGWFPTGDIAKADAEGRLFLAGRTTSVISVGGMKFFPEEVETVLCSHPSISEARVFGRPVSSFGMVPSAEIVLVKGAAMPAVREILSFCRERIARHKIPAEVAIVESLPRTPNGKIRRV